MYEILGFVTLRYKEMYRSELNWWNYIYET